MTNKMFGLDIAKIDNTYSAKGNGIMLPDLAAKLRYGNRFMSFFHEVLLLIRAYSSARGERG
jgi:hypothetical protein